MDHSHMSEDMSSESTPMAMVFTNSHHMPLLSSHWTPSSNGAYAGTCIFLIILSIIARCLVAFKSYMEQRWLNAHLKRRYVVVAGTPSEAERIDTEPDAKTGTLVTAQGVEESVRVVYRGSPEILPWRFSVDLPRALIYLCITGVSYLLYVSWFTWCDGGVVC
ncbi:Ctr copper transporter [Aspergillus egyptiacus]|nr:Ctr copper transporter [Aspergillus egyptiacus]